MSLIQTTLAVPEHIAAGLQSGLFERIGGVVRYVDSKQVVGWLREAGETGKPVMSEALSLSSVAAASSSLNLAISTMGFVVVLHRLKGIEKQLGASHEALEAIGDKIDLSFYANFRAAIDLAMNAFTMANAETRKMSALQAINRLIEAEHHYTQLVDIEIAKGSQAAEHCLATLGLSYVAEARCYLELEEIDTARRCLQEGASALRPRYQKHINTLLTPNPVVYLHPSLKEQIDLKRLTKIYQWFTPGINESDVFEMQRENFFKLALHPNDWVESLPKAIYASEKSHSSFIDLVKQPQKIAGMISSMPRGLPGRTAIPKTALDTNAEIYNLLPGVLDLIEQMIENDNRMEMYESEVETIQKLGSSFQEWRELSPPSTGNGNETNLMYICMANQIVA